MNTPGQLILNREILHNRHRLSHQQIDDFLGEKSKGLRMTEKMELMEQVREFLELTDILSKEGIDFIPLKGPLLSYRIYGDAACRISKDFDFLIEFNSMEKAIAVFKGLGFESTWYEWPTDLSLRKFKGNLRNQFHLVHPEKEQSIELHWKLFTFLPVKPAIIEQLVAENLTDLEFAGRKFKVLNSEMELLYLVIHGSMHTWRRLKWLVDVHEFVERKLIKEEKFEDLVKQVKAERLVAYSNEILKIIYPGKPTLPGPGKSSDFLVSHSIKRLEKDTDAEYDSLLEAVNYYRFVLNAFPGLRYKINTFKHLHNSMLDEGDYKGSATTLFLSFLNPLKFLKKRYRVE